MIQVAESNSQIGLVGPISNAVSGVQIDKEAKYNSIEEMHKYAASVRQKNKNQFSEFPRIAFLCTLIKKEVVKKIGGLDERFSPGNFEDDDFCLRAQLAGYKTVIAKDVFIHHFGSKSFTADGMKKYEERLEINKKIFIEKWGADPEEIWLHGKKIKERNIMYSIKQDDFIENFEQALSHLNQKEYELAFNSMVVSINNFDHEKAKIFNTDLHSVLNLAGNIGLLINKTEVARSYFEKALNNNPKSAEACNGLAEIFLLEENYEAANIMFGYAYNFDPNNKNALQGLEKVNALLSNSIKNENMNNNPDNNQLKIITKRNDLGSLLNSLNLKGHGAEIGVQQGEFSKIIRATWKGKYLHLIDRWRSDDDYKDIANVSDETHKQFYFKVLNLFADDQGVFVYKMDSNFAAQQFPDNYFDWIYLDADHSYDGCKKDLNVWYPKLKPGGIFAGHDFLNGNIPAGEFGVKAAVEEFIQDKEVQLSVTSEDLWKSWYLIKPGAQQYVWTKQTSEDEVINHQKSFENSNTTDKEVIKENIESDGLVSEAYELFNENKFDESLEKLLAAEKSFNGHLTNPTNVNSAAAFFNLKGFNYLGINDIESAKECFERALNLDPNSSEACAGLGEYFYMIGNNENAKIMFEFAVKNNPSNTFASDELSKIISISESDIKYNAVEENAEEKIKDKLNQILNSVYELFQFKKYDEAFKVLNNTEELFYTQVEIENDLVSSYENLKGIVLLSLKKNNEAKEAFEAALVTNPNSSQACAGLGEVLFLSGKDNEAKVMYEWGVKNNPQNQFAVEGLSKVNKVIGLNENHNNLILSE